MFGCVLKEMWSLRESVNRGKFAEIGSQRVDDGIEHVVNSSVLWAAAHMACM